MLQVQRANVVLDIVDEDLGYYMSLGYNLIDAQGNIVKKAVPSDIGELRTAFVQHQAKIAELEAQIEKLTKKASKKAKE